MTSICDERGEELMYNGVTITKILEQDLGIGGVLGLLWFQVSPLFFIYLLKFEFLEESPGL